MLKVGSRVRAKEGLYRKHLPEPVLIVNHVMPEIFQCFVMTPDGLTRHHGAWDMDVFEELPDAGQCFDIEPGEVALCDYSHPPDIHCRRVKTVGEVSDGSHTFDELHALKVELFIGLCRYVARWKSFPVNKDCGVWRSKSRFNRFLLGISTLKGQQIVFCIPPGRWDDCDFAETLDRAPEFDGHTSADVLERLKKI